MVGSSILNCRGDHDENKQRLRGFRFVYLTYVLVLSYCTCTFALTFDDTPAGVGRLPRDSNEIKSESDVEREHSVEKGIHRGIDTLATRVEARVGSTTTTTTMPLGGGAGGRPVRRPVP
jgi:hypothetical protein